MARRNEPPLWLWMIFGGLFFAPYVAKNHGATVGWAVALIPIVVVGVLQKIASDRRRKEHLQRKQWEIASEHWKQSSYLRSELAEIDVMTGIEFEEFVGAKLTQAGWNVTMTPKTTDYGVDIVAVKDLEHLAVQCKRLNKSVGQAAVREVVAGAKRYHCSRTMVVSNQEFTSAAQQLAAVNNCELIDRNQLTSWFPA